MENTMNRVELGQIQIHQAKSNCIGQWR